MRRFLLTAMIAAMLGAVHLGQPQQPDRIDQFVESERVRQKIPGVSVAVVRDGKLIKARGYGLSNVELNVPASERTIFESGSVGKQFTAAGILLLAEDGKLSLDDNISKYFPESPQTWKDITIRHLLTHTSGIRNYTGGQLDVRRDYTEGDLFKMATQAGIDFPPGTSWNYSNTGYILLGILIGKVSGQFYGDFLGERVFKPLGMDTTRIISEADIVPNRAGGYRLVNGALKNQSWVSPSLNTSADGSLYFSALDLSHWATVLEGKTFLSPASRKEWWMPVKFKTGETYPYSMGWFIDYMRGHRLIDHGGSWQGFKTHIARYPDDGLVIVVLTNLAQANPAPIAYGIAGLYKPELQPPHLLNKTSTDSRLEGNLKEFLQNFGSGDPKQDNLISAGFKSTTNSIFRNQIAAGIRNVQTFDLLTCDSVSKLQIEWNGSAIDRYCYARSSSASRASIFTFWLTAEGKIAGIGSYGF